MRQLAALILGLALAACGGGEGAAPAGAGGGASAPTDACTAGDTYGFVVSSLAFTRENPKGTAPGFDVDGVVSDGNDSTTCGHADLVDPAGTKGIDNQLAGLIPDVEKVVGNAVDGLVQGAINNGDLLIVFEATGVESLASDACVGVTTRIAAGVPRLDTQGALQAYQTFDPKKDAPVSHVDGARIEGSTLTAGPFELAIPFAIFDVSFLLHVHRAHFRFTLDEEGKLDGLLGGSVEVNELLDGVKQGAGVDKILPAIRLAMNAAADLDPDEDGHCKQLSVALAVKAVPAFLRPAVSD